MTFTRLLVLALIVPLLLLAVACDRQAPVADPPDGDEKTRAGADDVDAGGTGDGSEGVIEIEYDVQPSILFEAESGIVHAPVQVFEDADASGGTYTLAPEGPEHKEISDGGDVTYVFTVPEAGEYALWLRTRWCCSCADSLDVKLDGEAVGMVHDSIHEKWHWVQLNRKTVQLAEGERVLSIHNREDGSAWDQVLFLQDQELHPTGIAAADVSGRVLITDCKPPEAARSAE